MPGRSWATPGGLVVQRRSDGRVAVLGAPEAALWNRAKRPLPWPTDPADAARAKGLLAAGLLERLDDVRARLAAVPDAARPAPTAIFVPTRGPSPHLSRLLAALADSPTPVRVLVDDPDPAAAEAVRATTRADVIGAAERAAFVDALAEEIGDRAAVTDALVAPPGPWRVGALRNLVLLLSVGQIAVSVDDDVVPEVVGPPDPADRPFLLADGDPTSWWFFPDRPSAWRGGVAVDLAALHATAIGRRAARVWDDGLLDDASPDLLADLAGGADVVVTTLGLAGDYGSSRASGLLAHPPPLLARFVADYERHLGSRSVVRVAAATAVSAAPPMMAPCLGFDGRAVIPPFFTAHRNTDGMWSGLLGLVRPGVACHLPYAVRHDPTAARTYARSDVADHVARFRFTDLLGGWIRGRKPMADTPEARLAAVAHHVRTMSRDPAFADLVADVTRSWLAGMAGLVERARAVPGSPAWVEDLKAARAALGAALSRPVGPEEHLRDGVLDADALRADLDRYARLLDAWPRLRDGARRVA